MTGSKSKTAAENMMIMTLEVVRSSSQFEATLSKTKRKIKDMSKMIRMVMSVHVSCLNMCF